MKTNQPPTEINTELVEFPYYGKTYQAVRYIDSGAIRVLASEKVRMMTDFHKPYSITTDHRVENGFVISKASLFKDGHTYTGTSACNIAYHKDSAWALSETFATSRACSLFLGLEAEISSHEEMENSGGTPNIPKPEIKVDTNKFPADITKVKQNFEERTTLAKVKQLLKEKDINYLVLPGKKTLASLQALLEADDLKEYITMEYGSQTWKDYLKSLENGSTIVSDPSLDSAADSLLNEINKTDNRRSIKWGFDVPEVDKKGKRTDVAVCNKMWNVLAKEFDHNDETFRGYCYSYGGYDFKTMEDFVISAPLETINELFINKK